MSRTKPYSLILVVLIGFVIYSNILNAPFVLDDFGYIVNNRWVRSLNNLFDPQDARYVGFVTFALNYYFGGSLPGFHLTNIAIHVTNAVLIYFFITALIETMDRKGLFDSNRPSAINPRSIALCISLVFVAHPAGIYAVTYITQRFTSLATLFYLGALILYLKSVPSGYGKDNGRRRAKLCYAASLLLTVAAMKTKEISFTLPVLIVAVEFGLIRREGGVKGSVLRVLPFLLTMLIIPLVTLGIGFTYGRTENIVGEMTRQQKLRDLGAVSSYEYLLGQSRVVMTYLKMLIIPGSDSSACDFPPGRSIFDPATLRASAALLGLIAAATYLFIRSAARRNGYTLIIAAGVLWFFLTLSIESSVIPIKDLMVRHRTYLPGIGLITSAVTALFLLLSTLKRRFRVDISPVLLTAFVVLLLSITTYLNNRLWTDSVRLNLYLAELEPCDSSHHNRLAVIYARQGEWRLAHAELKEAARIKPEILFGWSNLAKASVRLGLFDEAVEQYKRVLALDPLNFDARYSLGLVYLKKELFDESEAEIDKALRLRPKEQSALKLRALLAKVRTGELNASDLKLRPSD